MDKRKRGFLMMVTFGLVVLLCAEKLTGSKMHLLLGILLILISAVHIKANKQKWAFRSVGIRAVDITIAGTLILMPLSGIALHINENLIGAKIVHKLSGVVFILGVAGHVWQHRKEKGKAGKIHVSQEINEGI